MHQTQPSRALQTTPRFDLLTDPNEPLAIDIEFVDWKIRDSANKNQHRIGRVALTNTRGDRIYDVFAKYPYKEDEQLQLPPRKLNLGVYWEDLKWEAGAKSSAEVLRNLERLMTGRPIVSTLR